MTITPLSTPDRWSLTSPTNKTEIDRGQGQRLARRSLPRPDRTGRLQARRRFNQVGDSDHEEWTKVELAQALGAEVQLLGSAERRVVRSAAASRSGEWAGRLNGLPRYLVSSTLADPAWNNSGSSRARW